MEPSDKANGKSVFSLRIFSCCHYRMCIFVVVTFMSTAENFKITNKQVFHKFEAADGPFFFLVRQI